MPWAIPKRAPRGRAIPCTRATDAFAKAMPASRAPIDIASRARSSDGSATTRGKAGTIRLMAFRASPSVSGCARRDTYASSACVKASIPAATAARVGTYRVRAGSATATSGKHSHVETSILRSRASSVTIRYRVASDPVPAVVAMHASGSRPGGTRSAPSNRASGPPCLARMAAALATSIALPPPSPMTPSTPAWTAAAYASSTRRTVGSPSTRSNIVTCSPASAKVATTALAACPARMNGSDTTRTWRTPVACMAAPASSAAPLPVRMRAGARNANGGTR